MSDVEDITTRNNPLREALGSPIQRAVDFIDEKAPWLTPNDITVAGTAGIIGISYLAAKRPKAAAALAVPYLGVVASDILDGGLARKRAAANGEETTSQGAILDMLADKGQEVATFSALAAIAHKNDQPVVAAAYALAAATSPMPAYFKADAEAHGAIVKEGGLGTRPIRVGMAVTGLTVSGNSRASLTIATGVLAQNVATSVKRIKAKDPDSPHRIGELNDAEAIKTAEERRTALRVASAVVAGAALGTAVLIKRGDPKLNNWQKVAQGTKGVVTPANIIDLAAFAMAMKNAPKMNTGRGITAMAASYAADLADGFVARRTGTTSEIGAGMDAVGDKLKTLYAAYYIYKLRMASRSTTIAVATHQAANLAASAYDRITHDKPKIAEVSSEGKKGQFADSFGLGTEVIGTYLASRGRREGTAVQIAARTMVAGGLKLFGIPATKSYWRAARS